MDLLLRIFYLKNSKFVPRNDDDDESDTGLHQSSASLHSSQ